MGGCEESNSFCTSNILCASSILLWASSLDKCCNSFNLLTLSSSSATAACFLLAWREEGERGEREGGRREKGEGGRNRGGDREGGREGRKKGGKERERRRGRGEGGGRKRGGEKNEGG